MARKCQAERVTNFSITATPTEKANIEAAARAAGLPRATYIRRALTEFITCKTRQVGGQQGAA